MKTDYSEMKAYGQKGPRLFLLLRYHIKMCLWHFAIFCIGVTICKTMTIQQNVQTFLTSNGFKYICLVENTSVPSEANWMLTKAIAKSGTSYIRTSTLNEHLKKYYFKFFDFHIFMLDIHNDDIRIMLYAVSQMPVRSSVLFIHSFWTESEEATVKEQLNEFGHDSVFFLAVASQSDVLWYQVISLKSGFSVNKLKFTSHNSHIVDDYDLNGLTIYSTSDSWAPYLTLENCDESGTNCTSYGYLKDYTDLVAKKYNFTYESHRDVTGNWGVFPISGPYNQSGEWGGIMGDVVNGKYDLCLSAWHWMTERYEILTFVPVYSKKQVLVWTPKNSLIDFGLVTRPFTEDSLMAIFLMTLIVTLCIFVTYFIIPNTENSNGHMIMVTTLWYFFVLLNAFYGGAMTMFFTSTINIQFEGITDVIRAYPEWKLVFYKGTEAVFALGAEWDPDYAKFWDVILTIFELFHLTVVGYDLYLWDKSKFYEPKLKTGNCTPGNECRQTQMRPCTTPLGKAWISLTKRRQLCTLMMTC
jgi:hypothetical protein